MMDLRRGRGEIWAASSGESPTTFINAVVGVYAGLTFCYSALAAVLPAFSTDLFGLPHAGVNYGFLALGQSAGSLLFPLLAGALGLEAGRHWLALGAAAAGFGCIWFLKPTEAKTPEM